MIVTIFLILIILGIITLTVPPLGAVIMQLLSMPLKIAFADIRIAGTLFSVSIILIALGIINI